MNAPPGGPIVFYDGVCALCDRFLQFTLRRDREGLFRFARLQGPLARDVLPRHGHDPSDLDTMVVLLDPGLPSERILLRGRAAVHVLGRLPGAWRLVRALGVLPAFLLDLGYLLVAKTRYRLFGRLDQCLLPRPEWRDRFLPEP